MGTYNGLEEEKLGTERRVHERSAPASGLGWELSGIIYSSLRALYKASLDTVLLASEMKFLSNKYNPSHLTQKRNWGSKRLSFNHTAYIKESGWGTSPLLTFSLQPGKNERKPQGMQGHHANNPVFPGLSPGEALSHNTTKETLPQMKNASLHICNSGRISSRS